jgi:hypothetical protein
MARIGADAIAVQEVSGLVSLGVRWVHQGRVRGARVQWERAGAGALPGARVVSDRPGGRVRLRALHEGAEALDTRGDPWARALEALPRGPGLTVLHRGGLEITLESPRVRVFAPTACRTEGGWLAAWLREDTGRVSLEVAAPVRGGIERRRVAEVWTALDPKALAAAAPCMAPRRGGGVWLAWREERGPKAAVYLKGLDASGRAEGDEVRVSTRGEAAEPVAPALAVDPRGRWLCAFAERRGSVARVSLAHG